MRRQVVGLVRSVAFGGHATVWRQSPAYATSHRGVWTVSVGQTAPSHTLVILRSEPCLSSHAMHDPYFANLQLENRRFPSRKIHIFWDMSFTYQRLPSNAGKQDAKKQPCGVRWMTIFLALISLCNMAIFAASLYLFRLSSARAPLPDSVAKAEELPTEFIKFNWHTPWSSNNDSEADQLWDNINTAHGHIAVDRDWASTQNVRALF